MSTIDSSGNVHKGKGTPGGGQFAGKVNAAPGGSLTDADDTLPVFTVDDIRCVEFTVESLQAMLDQDANFREVSADLDGNRRFQWATTGYSTTFEHRVTVDETGEVIALEEAWSRGDDSDRVPAWHDADPDQRELHDLRHRVNLDRLAFAGVLVHGVPNDGGAYGNRFVGGRAHEKLFDAAEVSKRIREDLKKAQAVGAIPSDLTYRVTTQKYAGGQSITVHAEGVPDSKLYQDRPDGHRGRHPWGNELDKTISVIGEQWQDSEIDSMTDYYNVRYWFHVSIPDERSMNWHREQRAEAARKRAARKAAKV